MKEIPTTERNRRLFARYVSPELTKSGCREWTGYPRGFGYGNVILNKSSYSAHRVAWVFAHGSTNGLCVLHRCDNPKCVNVEHLFLGTQGDNQADKMRKGRANTPRGERNGSTKFREADVRAIREMRSLGYTVRRIAPLFNCSVSTIVRIGRRESWRHLS